MTSFPSNTQGVNLFGQPQQQATTSTSFGSGFPQRTAPSFGSQGSTNPFGLPQQPTATSSAPFGGGFSQQPAPVHTFGIGSSTSTIGQPQTSALAGPTQFSQPQGGLFSNTGLSNPRGSIFSQPGQTNPFSFGASNMAAPSSSTLFGAPGDALRVVGQQPQQAFAESSRQHVCVQKETLEQLKGIEWGKVNEGALFHELPEALKAVLVDIATRIRSEEASREEALRAIADVRESLRDIGRIVPPADCVGESAPTVSESVALAVEAVRKTSAATLERVEEEQSRLHTFSALIQRSLRGLLDAVSGRGPTCVDEGEHFALLDAESRDTSLRLERILMRLQSLAIRWPSLSGRFAPQLQDVVDSLRAVFHQVCTEYGRCHDFLRNLCSDAKQQ